MTSQKPLKRITIAAYSLPALPVAALGLPLVVYLPNFYVEHVGLSAAAVGLVFMVMRFWDVVTDPMLGIISDRWKTRWGRRRHWIVLSVPILSLAGWMIFFPPEGAGVSYLMVWMFFLYIGWTLLIISHHSWGAELTPVYHERSRIHGWREFVGIFGLMTVLALPALIDSTVPDATRQQGVEAMGWFFVLCLPIAVLLAVTGAPERPTLSSAAKLPWLKAIAALRGNAPMRYVLVTEGILGLATGITGSLFLWFTADIMKLDKSANFILLCYFAAGLIAVPFWIEVARRIGKHKTLAVASAFGAAVLPVLAFVEPGAFWPILIGHVIYGTAYGAGHFLVRAIMADVTDHDALETGQERTGLFYALMTMSYKVGLALAVGISLTTLQFLGFEAGSETPYSPVTIYGFYGLYLFLPALLMATAAVVMWRFPLDADRQKELREGLERRAREDMTGGG